MPDADKVEPATLADLRGKPVAEKVWVVPVADDRRVSLRLRAIGRPAFDALVESHPPRDGVDLNEFGMPKRWAPSFWPALVAASLVEPPLSEAEVNEFWGDWSKADTDALAQAAYDLNEGRSSLEELGKPSGVSAVTPPTDD